MCSILILSKISGGLNTIVDKTRNSYCKYAIKLYDPIKPRSLQVPFRESFDLSEIDGSEDSTLLTESFPSVINFVDYKTVNLLNLDPEIYYFFKHYNSNSISDFHLMLDCCGIIRKDSYYADLIDKDEKLKFVFDESEGKIIAEINMN